MKKIFILSVFVFISFLFCTNVNAETGEDLIVSDIQVNEYSTEYYSGHEIVVTVKNVGDTDSALNSSLVLTYGTNFSAIESCQVGNCEVGNGYNASIYTSAYGKNSLAPEEEYDIVFDDITYLLDQVEFDEGVNYLIKAIVDDGQLIDEANEDNNTHSEEFSLESESDLSFHTLMKSPYFPLSS